MRNNILILAVILSILGIAINNLLGDILLIIGILLLLYVIFSREEKMQVHIQKNTRFIDGHSKFKKKEFKYSAPKNIANICNECGTENLDSAKFCAECGKKL